MQQKRSLVRNRRGAALVIVAIALSGLLSMLALAIDLGMLYKTHVEAQRAADAAALAGASVFMELAIQDADKVDSAYVRAHQLAEANYMTGGLVVSGEVTVQVIPDSEKVRVWVKRDSVPTWFARIFGIEAVPIGAKAAAEATDERDREVREAVPHPGLLGGEHRGGRPAPEPDLGLPGRPCRTSPRPAARRGSAGPTIRRRGTATPATTSRMRPDSAPPSGTARPPIALRRCTRTTTPGR